MAQFAGHINLSPAIVRDDLPGADPELAASASSAYLCYPVLVLRERKGREREEEDRQRDDVLCASPSGLCFFNGHKLKLKPV